MCQDRVVFQHIFLALPGEFSQNVMNILVQRYSYFLIRGVPALPVIFLEDESTVMCSAQHIFSIRLDKMSNPIPGTRLFAAGRTTQVTNPAVPINALFSGVHGRTHGYALIAACRLGK